MRVPAPAREGGQRRLSLVSSPPVPVIGADDDVTLAGGSSRGGLRAGAAASGGERAARLGALLALALVIDAAAGPRWGPAGPDVLLVAVAAVAGAYDRNAAAAFGFAAGIAADLFLATPAGVCAFVYTVVAWAAAGEGGADGESAGDGPGGSWERARRAAARTGAVCLTGGGGAIGAAALFGAAPLPGMATFAALVAGSLLAALAAPAACAAVRWLSRVGGA